MIILYNILGTITWYKHMYLLPLTLITTFILSYYIFKKRNEKYLKNGILLCMPLTIINIIICTSINDFSRGLLYIIFVPISTYLAFLYFRLNKIIIPILSLLLIAFISFIVFPNYFIYYHNHNAEKNVKFPNITFVDSESKKINFNDDKIIILDFWSTSCGICFEKFPMLEEIYLQYKNNKRIEIYTVNVPIRGDKFNKTIKILDSIGYKFPKIYAKSLKEVEDSLHFNTFPNLIIIKNGRIRYEGVLETKNTSMLYNIEDKIAKLTEEKQ